MKPAKAFILAGASTIMVLAILFFSNTAIAKNLLTTTDGHPPVDWSVYEEQSPEGESTFTCSGTISYMGVTSNPEDSYGFGCWITDDLSWDLNNGTITMQYEIPDSTSDTNTVMGFSLLDDGNMNSAFWFSYQYLDDHWVLSPPGRSNIVRTLEPGDIIKVVFTKNTDQGQATLWELFLNGESLVNDSSEVTTGGMGIYVLRSIDGFSYYRMSALTITQETEDEITGQIDFNGGYRFEPSFGWMRGLFGY
jgi:hypothetical protein